MHDSSPSDTPSNPAFCRPDREDCLDEDQRLRIPVRKGSRRYGTGDEHGLPDLPEQRVLPGRGRTRLSGGSGLLAGRGAGALVFDFVQDLPDSLADREDAAGRKGHVTDPRIVLQLDGASEVDALERCS